MALAQLAHANAPGVLDHGSIEIGVASSSLDGSIGVDGTALGTDVDLSRDLDLGGRENGALLDMRWRPFDRHEFSVRGQRFGRSRERTISRDIVFDDEVFTINSRVKGDIDLDVWTLNYTGWLIADERRALGVSVGALQYRLGLRLEVKELPGGVQVEPIEADVSEELPVWVLGTEFRQQLGDRWRIVFRASIFEASVNRIDGTVFTIDGGVEYTITDQIALALRYSQTRLDAEATRSDLTGRLHFDLASVQSGLIWRW